MSQTAEIVHKSGIEYQFRRKASLPASNSYASQHFWDRDRHQLG
ncbi:MAG: hypothetical protein WCB92_26655 [Mycobacterium sp.]